jgi:uncharacterized membrane protein YwaF
MKQLARGDVMLLYDFMNPYIIYFFFLGLYIFTTYAIFKHRAFFIRHRKKILLTVAILLGWTQIARYIGIFFNEDVYWNIGMFNFRIIAFDWGTHLPFYVCRLSVVVLLYYAITKDKRVESFIFYWGATGLAGILYPNSSDFSDIAILTETFYFDHFLLAVSPYFLLAVQGYKPIRRDLFIITGVMFGILIAFIPINALLNEIPNIGSVADYFYVSRQSIFGELFPGQHSLVFIAAHTLVAFGFFSLYYNMFKNRHYNYEN